MLTSSILPIAPTARVTLDLAGPFDVFLKYNRNYCTFGKTTTTPELSVIEEYWHQSILVSEYYGTFGKMKHALSEYEDSS